MTDVKPGLAAALCHACRHPTRNHGKNGCALGICWCTRTGDELAAPSPTPAPASAVEPPTGRALDLLDPLCGCGHRRGRHAPSGGGRPMDSVRQRREVTLHCGRCSCHNFTPDGGADASAAAPAEPTPPAPATAPAPAAPPTAPDRPARQSAVQRAVAPRTPRRTAPRPAGDMADDADEEVVTVSRPPSAAVTTDLDRFRACPIACGWTQEPTEFDDEVGLRAARAQHLNGHSSYEIIVALERGATVATTEGTEAISPAAATVLTEDLLFASALFVAAHWYCPGCHQWHADPGACPGCSRTLRPVFLATIPREVS